MTNRIPEDAFEYYVSLGADRSYEAVAKRYGVGKRAVTKRAVRDGWSQRLTSIERQARERTDKKIAECIEDMRLRHLATLKAMHARALSALKQFPLNSAMEAMRTAEMVIKLERLVAGEASDRTALTIEEVTKREIENLLVPDDGEGTDDDSA